MVFAVLFWQGIGIFPLLVKMSVWESKNCGTQFAERRWSIHNHKILPERKEMKQLEKQCVILCCDVLQKIIAQTHMIYNIEMC